MYSNTSFSPSWYNQPVNRDTGVLYGTPVVSKSMFSVNASWFQEALNNTTGHSSLATGWNNAEGTLFYDTVAMDARGVISLGFPAKVVLERLQCWIFMVGIFIWQLLMGK